MLFFPNACSLQRHNKTTELRNRSHMEWKENSVVFVFPVRRWSHYYQFVYVR